MSAFRSQSAMEYLMTYGWSILIIAVVLGALFQLGVFNTANFAPKAQPGNCKVFRAAGTSSLVGTCTGILPQSVAMFNGQGSYVNAGNGAGLNIAGNAITVAAWVYSNPSSSYRTVVSKGYFSAGSWELRLTRDSEGPNMNFGVATSSGYASTTISGFQNSAWHNVAGVYDGTKVYIYQDGKLIANSLQTGGIVITSNNVEIGWHDGLAAEYFNGQIANVQIYNTSIDANQIQALYIRGIGAAPVDPAHIVGWWPLNGDVNDYAGNNNGAPTGVTYTSSWLLGYTSP
jgi:Concanavalin A-like lectin/glucanases superfamily